MEVIFFRFRELKNFYIEYFCDKRIREFRKILWIYFQQTTLSFRVWFFSAFQFIQSFWHFLCRVWRSQSFFMISNLSRWSSKILFHLLTISAIFSKIYIKKNFFDVFFKESNLKSFLILAARSPTNGLKFCLELYDSGYLTILLEKETKVRRKVPFKICLWKYLSYSTIMYSGRFGGASGPAIVYLFVYLQIRNSNHTTRFIFSNLLPHELIWRLIIPNFYSSLSFIQYFYTHYSSWKTEFCDFKFTLCHNVTSPVLFGFRICSSNQHLSLQMI